MGMSAKKAHTVEEYVEISEMEKMVEVLKAIFVDLCR
jgi:acetylornithine deacetylase/succinyl-diaminopimelate desuccinylase-like protein